MTPRQQVKRVGIYGGEMNAVPVFCIAHSGGRISRLQINL